MKRIYFIAVLLISLFQTTAQTPNQFKYQAVLRDANGTIIANEQKTIVIDILQGSSNGSSVFTETHQATTSAQGVINLNIGSINTSGLSAINWTSSIYFIKITVNNIAMGTSQLLAVPYALAAKTAETADYTKLTNKPTIPSAADGSETKINAGTNVTITGSGTSASPYVVNATAILPSDASTGDMAYYNGAAWVKISAPSSNSMVLTYCKGKPVWTKDGNCPIEVGDQVQGGWVYKIFQSGDAGYVSGETHGMVTSATLGTSTYYASGSFVNTLNAGTYNNWRLPTYVEIGEIANNRLSLTGITFDFNYHWSSSMSGGSTVWVFAPGGGGASVGVGSTCSVLAVRQF